MKRVISIIISCFMMLSCMSLFSFAADPGELVYIIKNEVAILTDVDNKASGTLSIPDVYKGYPVKKIGVSAFENCINLTAVNIPDSVVSIEDYAFDGCIELESVSIPKSVTRMGSYIFRNCLKLKNVTLPYGITEIGTEFFKRCESLEYINIPESVTKINDYAFFCCHSLKSIDFHEGITYIGASAFNSCWNITTVEIPNGITKINPYTFADCRSLEKVILPNTVSIIYDGAFQECTSLKSIVIPHGTKYIYGSFSKCTALESIVLPDTVLYIFPVTFYNCTMLQDVWYEGSEAKFNDIEIHEHGNEHFINAAKHYSCCPGIGPHSFKEYPHNVCDVCDAQKVFSDVTATKWYASVIDYAVANGIFSGTGENVFEPDKNMTRAQFVQVFANISGADISDRTVGSGFTDVPKNKWYTGAVTWATQNKIVSGMGDGTFAPDANVTREQMCVMLVNFIENYQKSNFESKAPFGKFTDDSMIASWAKAQVYKCADAGVINGVGNKAFDPKGNATRAQGASVFSKLHKEYIVK